MRSTRDMITFQHPFTVPGLDGPQAPGVYMVITEEEEIPGLSFQAWRRVSTQIYLPAMGVVSAQEQVTTIDPLHLAEAKSRDDARQSS